MTALPPVSGRRRWLLRQAQLLTCALMASVPLVLALVQLTFLLNPDTDMGFIPFIRLAALLCWPYGLLPIAAVVLGFHVLQFFAGRPIELWWFSVKVLSWSFFGIGAGVASLFLRNILLYREILADSLVLVVAAGVWLAMSLAMVVVAMYDYFFPKARWRRVGVLVPIAAFAAVLLPLWGVERHRENGGRAESFRSKPESRITHGRLVLIGMEGGTLNHILPLVSQGRLPSFQALLRNGAGGRMETLVPAQSRPLWATLLTGKQPSTHGVIGEFLYEFPAARLSFRLLPRTLFFQSVLERTRVLRVTSAPQLDRRCLCYWDFLGDQPATLIDMWVPVGSLRGFIIGNPVYSEAGRFYPRGVEGEARRVAAEAETSARARVSAIVGLGPNPDQRDWRLSRLIHANAGDECARRLGSIFATETVAVRFRGLDLVSHFFPATFAGESFGDFDSEQRPFEHALEQHYVFYDEILATYMASLPDDTVLCVVSIFGMDPLPPWRRMVEMVRARPTLLGGHESGPDGFVYFYGKDIATGVAIEGASIYDVLPTLLYFQGVPIGMDMEGRILLDVFTKQFRETHPASYVPTHEAVRQGQ